MPSSNKRTKNTCRICDKVINKNEIDLLYGLQKSYVKGFVCELCEKDIKGEKTYFNEEGEALQVFLNIKKTRLFLVISVCPVNIQV